MVVHTEFDNPLEEDVVFEETDETQSFEDILKNSENLMKSFLYMKKMFSAAIISPTEFNFISSDGQRDFQINGHFFTYAMVFTEGIKEKNSDFEISENAEGSMITFTQAKTLGLWINIVIFT